MSDFEKARERIKDWCQQLGLDYEAHYSDAWGYVEPTYTFLTVTLRVYGVDKAVEALKFPKLSYVVRTETNRHGETNTYIAH